MVTTARFRLLACLSAAVLAGPMWGQAPMLEFRLVSPAENAYMSGPSQLRALVLPPQRESLVESVTFFVDGKVACRVTAPPFECAWDAGMRIKEHLVRAVASLKDGSRIVETVRTKGEEFAESVDVNVVQVTASVTDGDGRFVSSLERNAFKVYEDNVPQRITFFAAEHTPLEVVVAVDVSGSMGGVMTTVKESVKRFLGALREGDQVTLIAFNDTIFTLGRRETTTAGRIRAIDRLSSWGGTALYDAVVRSIDLLGRQQGRRALVIFSDGEDQSSHIPLDSVVRRVETSDATVYFIGEGRGTEVESLKQIQDRLARVSGGRAFQVPTVDGLDAIFEQILTELSNQYLLAYQPSNPALDDSWREIRVELANPHQKVRARQGYRA